MNLAQVLKRRLQTFVSGVINLNLNGKVVILKLSNLVIRISDGAMLTAGDQNRLMLVKTVSGPAIVERLVYLTSMLDGLTNATQATFFDEYFEVKYLSCPSLGGASFIVQNDGRSEE